jgi:hypothetical protein
MVTLETVLFGIKPVQLQQRVQEAP